MFVQILIYVYLGICAGMILFNIVTALLSQRREHRSFRDGIRLELTVSRELDRLAETGAVSERHLRFMERRLRRVNGMAAFDAALECLCVRRPELTRAYLTALDQKKPVVVCGDMNVAHREIDLKNPKTNVHNAGFTQEERDKMSALLERGFVDSFRYLHPDDRDRYSWWSYMMKSRERNIGWRIDYFLVSRRIAENIVSADIDDQIMGSDHCPVILELKGMEEEA